MSYSAQRVSEKRDPDPLPGDYGFEVNARMSGEGVVTISADRILEIADRMKELEGDLRRLGLEGFGTQPTSQTLQKQKLGMEPMPLTFDILSLDWKRSAKAGGGDAGPNDKWCWTFAYPDADSPEPRSDCYDLVMAILRYKVVQCGRYQIKLAGRDFRLLNRTIA